MSETIAAMHVLSHRHGDHEWYQDRQGLRQRLVFQIDALLDLFDHRPDYRFFYMDGQTSCLYDYLEVRPEQRERLAERVREGRIMVGPWFVLPSETLLSAESLVRNLLLGLRSCHELGGEPMPVGSVADLSGHCSQLPQILHGFGIDSVIVHRALPEGEESPGTVCEGTDGSTVHLVRYPGHGNRGCSRPRSDSALPGCEDGERSTALAPVSFGLDGGDRLPSDLGLPGFTEKLNYLFHGARRVHPSMVEYLRGDKEASELNAVSTRGRTDGEPRMPEKRALSGATSDGVGSARIYIKQANDRLEYLLPRCAEPLHVWARLVGGEDRKAFLDLAWRYMIANHPHDAMGGCSIDKTHRDMMYRFSEADAIAWNSIWESVQTIGEKLDTASLGGERSLTIYNMATVDTPPITRFSFELPQRAVQEGHANGCVPTLIDADGRPIHMEIEETEPCVGSMSAAKCMPDEAAAGNGGVCERFHATGALSVPAMGYESFRVELVPRTRTLAAELPARLLPVISSGNHIENEFISLTARDDGLVDLLDKKTGQTYADLHQIEDCGDAGTGWKHIAPQDDAMLVSTDGKIRDRATVWVRQTGPLSASLTVSYSIRTPCGLSKDRLSRSRRRVQVRVETVYTLDAGSRRIDCRTTIGNSVRDHRMTAVFPTRPGCDRWFGDSAGDIVERVLRADPAERQGPAHAEAPIKNMVATCDADSGLAILTKGLCEVSVRDDGRGSIALTLLRGFSHSIGGHWTKDSQVLGDVVLEYALFPFTPVDAKPGPDVMREIEVMKIPVVSLTSEPHPGDLQPSGRMLHIGGDVVLSTVKQAEDGDDVIVRLFNPHPTMTVASLVLGTPVASAWKCDLAERPAAPIQITEERLIDLPIRAKKMATIRVTFAR